MDRSRPYPIRGRGRGRGRGDGRRTQRFVFILISWSLTESIFFFRSVPSTIVQFITSTKLQELEKQKNAHSLVLNRISLTEDDIVRRLEVLLEVVSTMSGTGALDPSSVIWTKLDPSNLDLMLSMARRDPTFNKDVLKSWVGVLEAHITHSSTRFEFAQLLGELFNEWLTSGDADAVNKITGSVVEVKSDMDADDETFVKVESKETVEDKGCTWPTFSEANAINTEGLISYLTDIFSNNSAAGLALLTLRADIDKLAQNYTVKDSITTSDVFDAIISILNSDIAGQDKRNTLHELSENDAILEDISNIISMRLHNLAAWSWPQGVASMTFVDLDIIDAIFLNFIGLKWQNHFRQAFETMLRGQKWKCERLSAIEIQRREALLGEKPSPAGIELHRQQDRARYFCCHRLHSDVFTVRDKDYLDPDDYLGPTYSTIAIRQKLLNILTAECHLNKTLGRNYTIVHGEIDSISASLPHESTISILACFGVPQHWLEFFKGFLKTPLRSEDGPVGLNARHRERGTPDGFTLSTLFEEVVLFAMEFAVNEAAQEPFLYRVGNKFWFGNADPNMCVAAWEAIRLFTSMVGLKVISAGSACVGDDIDSRLPLGAVPLGFLKFDSSCGRFVIDQQLVTDRIPEMRQQLTETKSVVGWVNMYNRFMELFYLQFGGRPSRGLGLCHVEDMIQTFSRIQTMVLGTSCGSGSGLVHLKNMLEERFGVRDLPDGCIYFPINRGGLGLRNPIIDLIALKDDVYARPGTAFTAQVNEDRTTYEKKKLEWEHNPSNHPPVYGNYFPRFPMSYEAYISERETRFPNWASAYLRFLGPPSPARIELTSSLKASLKITENRWMYMDYYDRWVAIMYGEEIVKRFGSLEIVDPAFIPAGMIELFRSKSKVRCEL